jgi:hypothetical protein
MGGGKLGGCNKEGILLSGPREPQTQTFSDGFLASGRWREQKGVHKNTNKYESPKACIGLVRSTANAVVASGHHNQVLIHVVVAKHSSSPRIKACLTDPFFQTLFRWDQSPFPDPCAYCQTLPLYRYRYGA